MMLRRLCFAAALAGLGLAAPAAARDAHGAPDAPAGLVWMVLTDINTVGLDREDPTNRPPLVTQVPAGVIRAVNLSHDARPDWLIDYEPAELSHYCGTGGCTKTLYVSHGDDGLVRAFDQQAHTLTLYEAEGESRIEAEVHHALCSSDASRDCAFAWAWDADLGRLVERPNRAGHAIIPVGAFPPVDRSEDRGPNPDAPEAVADIWFTTRRTCSSVYNDDGLEVNRAAIVDIPDVDGDGVRDWLVEPPAECPPQPGDEVPYPGFQIWLTRADGAAVRAYVSPAERYPYLDVSKRQAVVITEPSCGLPGACGPTRLRWDAAAARLVE